MFEQEEIFFICPYCMQRISMLIDLSVEEQEYIEDCEVCCRPIQLYVHIADGELVDIQAEALEG